MPANTADGWPYVLPADYPKEYPAHSQALANKLDSTVKRMAAGVSSVSGSNTTIAFPVGRFTAMPVVVATHSGGFIADCFVEIRLVTKDGFQAMMYNSAGSVYHTGLIQWVAMEAG